MFGIRVFLFGLLVGACAGLFVANYHVVNTPQGVVVVPRSQRPPLRSSYVDIRSWSQAMWTNHPEVTQALVADGRSELIRDNLKDNLLNEILPEQTQDERPQRSRNVARRTEVPIPIEGERAPTSSIVADKPAASRNTTRLLDSKSPMRKQWEAAVDEAIAPIVEEDPAELATGSAPEVLPSDAVDQEMVRKLEEKLGSLLEATGPSTTTGRQSSTLDSLPSEAEANEMVRDLFKEVIPQGSQPPGSAAPLRDLGLDFLSAPAPGQGGASKAKPIVPTQSQLIRSQPF
jgi:hypothetical protein